MQFEVKIGTDSAKIADVYKTRAGKMSDMNGEAKVLVKITSNLRTGELAVNV